MSRARLRLSAFLRNEPMPCAEKSSRHVHALPDHSLQILRHLLTCIRLLQRRGTWTSAPGTTHSLSSSRCGTLVSAMQRGAWIAPVLISLLPWTCKDPGSTLPVAIDTHSCRRCTGQKLARAGWMKCLKPNMRCRGNAIVLTPSATQVHSTPPPVLDTCVCACACVLSVIAQVRVHALLFKHPFG